MFFAKADMEPVHFPIFAQPHIGLKVNGRFALLRTRRSRSHLSASSFPYRPCSLIKVCGYFLHGKGSTRKIRL